MYLDPGFGGMLLQAVVVIAAVGGALVYSFRRKIRNLFSKKKGDGGEDAKPSSAADVADDIIDTLADDE